MIVCYALPGVICRVTAAGGHTAGRHAIVQLLQLLLGKLIVCQLQAIGQLVSDVQMCICSQSSPSFLVNISTGSPWQAHSMSAAEQKAIDPLVMCSCVSVASCLLHSKQTWVQLVLGKDIACQLQSMHHRSPIQRCAVDIQQQLSWSVECICSQRSDVFLYTHEHSSFLAKLQCVIYTTGQLINGAKLCICGQFCCCCCYCCRCSVICIKPVKREKVQ